MHLQQNNSPVFNSQATTFIFNSMFFIWVWLDLQPHRVVRLIRVLLNRKDTELNGYFFPFASLAHDMVLCCVTNVGFEQFTACGFFSLSVWEKETAQLCVCLYVTCVWVWVCETVQLFLLWPSAALTLFAHVKNKYDTTNGNKKWENRGNMGVSYKWNQITFSLKA